MQFSFFPLSAADYPFFHFSFVFTFKLISFWISFLLCSLFFSLLLIPMLLWGNNCFPCGLNHIYLLVKPHSQKPFEVISAHSVNMWRWREELWLIQMVYMCSWTPIDSCTQSEILKKHGSQGQYCLFPSVPMLFLMLRKITFNRPHIDCLWST